MRLIDRYLYRAIIPPFLIALGVFTFLMAINPMLEYATRLIAKGVQVPTVGLMLLTLLPQAFSLTIPIAFLTGILMGLGRLSGDRESVALQACGVSPLRILRPILVLALIVAAFDMYVLMRLKPDANQYFRDIAFQQLTEKSSADIKPRVFYEGFPQKVIYVQNTTATGVWSGVLVADTSDPLKPSLVLAETGQLVLDKPGRMVQLVLTNATRYAPGKPGTTVYSVSREATSTVAVTAEAVFGGGQLGGGQARGFPEMDYAALERSAAEKRLQGLSTHNEILHQQQMFSFPVACIIFAVIGLGLGLHTRKEGKLAGFAVAIGVVLVYYAFMALAESWVKGNENAWISLPPHLGRWVPNIVLGVVGIILLWRRSRSVEGRLQLSLPKLRRQRSDGTDAVEAGPAPERPVVVLRVPEISVPGPRILDRYVTAYYLKIAALALVGLLAVSYLVTFVDMSDKVFKGQAGLPMLLALLWYQTPQFLAYILPIAVLIGVLGTIGGLTRSSELMVMRACGISLYRVAAPMIALAVIASGILFVLDDRVIGEATLKAETLNADIRKIERPRLSIANPNWLVGQDGRIYHYQAYEPATATNGHQPTLYGVSVFELADQPFRLTQHTYVSRASYVSPQWQARDGWRQAFRAGDAGDDKPLARDREDFSTKTLAMPPVEDFRRAQIDSSRMTFGQLRQYVRRLGSSGVNVSEQESHLHRKLAFPAVTLVLTLLAIPFGATTGKKGALYGIGLALVLAAAYFLLTTLFMAAGAAGALPAPLAAWAVNLLFAIGALYLVFTVRT